jgi:hypothetical protein
VSARPVAAGAIVDESELPGLGEACHAVGHGAGGASESSCDGDRTHRLGDSLHVVEDQRVELSGTQALACRSCRGLDLGQRPPVGQTFPTVARAGSALDSGRPLEGGELLGHGRAR